MAKPISREQKTMLILLGMVLAFWGIIFLFESIEKKPQNVTINTTVIDMSQSDTIIIVRDGVEKYKLIKID